MIGVVHRGFYIFCIIFFVLIGMLLTLIGEVEFFKTTLNPQMFKLIYMQPEPNVSIMLISVGVGVAVISVLFGLGGGLICKFSKKDYKPEKVDVLRAQDIAVFLVDGQIYKRTDAESYNLKDLSRVRVTVIRNLYYTILEEGISIAPAEEIADETNTTSDSDQKQETSSTGEESDSDSFTL